MNKLNQIGSSDLKVSPIGFGSMHFGVTVDLAQSLRLLDAYAGNSGAFVDTANIYSRNNPLGLFHEKGQSEQFIGDWLRKTGKRSQVTLATKVFSDMGDGFAGLSKKSIAYQIDQSLKRLNTDYVDLYQLHSFDRDVPIEETLQALNTVVESGKARFVGCCNMNYEQIRKYQDAAAKLGFQKLISYQNSYNLIISHRLRNEHGVFLLNEKEKRELDVTLISYRSLVNGFLAGKYKEHQSYKMDSDAQKAVERNCFNQNGWHLLKILNDIAEAKSATMMQVTLAAYRLDPRIGVSLVGFSKVEQIEEAAGSLGIDLSKDELQTIDLASAKFIVK